MRSLAIKILTIGLALTGAHAYGACDPNTPPLGTDVVEFEAELNVNPDGTPASYAPGDHGFTYIVNGVNLIRNGRKVSCQSEPRTCRRLWLEAEQKGFARGTQEFCSFAIEVERFDDSAPLRACEGSSYRRVIGNGAGKPKLGDEYPLAAGGVTRPYVSMTALRHTKNGKAAWLDSSVVPSVVVPRSHRHLLGAVAFVEFGNKRTFAIVGDIGPKFGEGSIALHQLLRLGELQDRQPLGPIPLNQRCTYIERDLKPPFMSRPDYRGDRCKAGRQPRGASDIRAYNGLQAKVRTKVLSNIKLPMNGNIIKQEVTVLALKKAAAAAGFCPK